MSSDTDEEDYVEFGNALEPLDEEALPRKKPFALEDQVAKDKHGRRRFHGAFTGGFSAGFFNSVGSLEGWTPSSFKSSRSEKANIKTQKPEDFMDDEDTGEFGIAPKVLRATNDYSTGKKRERIHHISDGPIPGEPVLQLLLQPTRETIGVKLLKKMGWKPGQGIGPRVTKREKKQMKDDYNKAAVKVYGCSLPEEQTTGHQESISDDEDVDALVTFAPEDIPSLLCKPKDNCFGLGYSGLDRRPVLSSHVNLFAPSTLKMEEKKKKVSISGQAFGVGVLEEDDEDIYGQEDMSQYDFTMDSAPSKGSQKSRFSEATPLANYAGNVLEGFVLSSKQLLKKKYFSPPLLPQGYQPLHSTRISRFEPAKDAVVEHSKKKGLQRHNLTATERLQILEEPNKNSLTKKSTSLEEEKKILKEEALKITGNSSSLRHDGSYSFKPFVAHPEKQERYEHYLALAKLGQKDRLSYFQPLTMTEWEKERERREFEQAARLYQPLTGLMSERFVSATHSDEHPLPNKADETESDQKSAAKIKMFGQLTREESDWQPCSLLCKRFNIPELHPSQGDVAASTKKKSLFSVFDILEGPVKSKKETIVKEEEKEKEDEDKDTEVSKSSSPASEDEAQEQNIELVNENKDTSLEFPDPPAKIDLYKAIFLSSSSDSESEDNEDSAMPPSDANIPHPSSTNVEDLSTPAVKANINSSPPRGVFANLDLDAIISHRKDRTTEQQLTSMDSTCSEGNTSTVAKSSAIDRSGETLSESDNMYGPSLPAACTPHNQDKAEKPSSSKILPSIIAIPNAVWVEKTKDSHKTKHHKKHKKASKHKKHKSKTKHKKKRH